jgi:hypothetical protein
MAKSIRSKWKRKMRAIKRVGMDEKVLIRMKKMLAENEKAEREEELEKEKEQKEKAKSSDSVDTDVALEVQTGNLDLSLFINQKSNLYFILKPKQLTRQWKLKVRT